MAPPEQTTKKTKKKNWKKAKAWQHSRETRPAQPENQLCVHSCMKYVVSCAACRSPRTRSSSLHPTSPTTTQNRYIHCGSSWKKDRKTEKKQHVVSVLADVSFFFLTVTCSWFFFSPVIKTIPLAKLLAAGPDFLGGRISIWLHSLLNNSQWVTSRECFPPAGRKAVTSHQRYLMEEGSPPLKLWRWEIRPTGSFLIR